MASSSVQDQFQETYMKERIRAFDWASTPLGPMGSWPEPLRMALSIAEHSAFPTAIYWGPELRLLYNNAWAAIPGERHPAALGQPAEKVWYDIWPVVGPQFRQVMETGEGFSAFEQMLPMVRDGVPRETYWNYSFTPLFDENGKVAGIFNQGNEVTRTVVAERRLSFQVQLADRLRESRTPEDAKAAATRMLGEYLGAARVGYGEVNEEGNLLASSRDWTRDESIPSVVGEKRLIADFGEEAHEWLLREKLLVVEDRERDLRTSNPQARQTLEDLGVRAMIVVPLIRNGEFRGLLFVHDTEPRQWKRSEVAIARDVAERTWAAVERGEAEQRLRESEDHYRHAVELNPQVSWTALPDGQLNRVSARWQEWTGTTGLGDTWAGGLHPDDRGRTFDVWGHCVATGEPYDILHRVRHRDGNYRWARSRAFPRRADSGQICLWYGTTEDVHDQKIAEEHQRLLINELNHRVKNTLATVQAIAFQTLKGDIPLEEARGRFEARLLALSRAHNMLTEQNWDGAALEAVVEDATGHFAERHRFEVEGPSLWVAPRAGLALALAFHELSTNAAKYGALSNDHGIVSVSWWTENGKLRLEWKERGGPKVVEPERRGFGSRLIERGLAADLGGGATLHFESSGLCCVVEASLDAIQARENELG